VYIILGMAFQRNFYGDQYVFIHGTEIKGVQSFDGSWSIPRSNMLAAGYEYVGSEIEGVLEGDISISRLIVESSDPIVGHLGSEINGELVYGPNQSTSKSFWFDQGFVNSYSSSCSVGEVATSDFGITAYGSVGATHSNNSKKNNVSYNAITPKVATANSMTLTTSFGSTNAIQSYDLSLSLDLKPVYKMGNMFIPSKFEIATPIVISTSFEILTSDYEIENLYHSVCSTNFVENLAISLNEKCNGPEIRSFTLNNADLIGSSISAGIGDNLSISLEFENKFDDISTLVSAVF